MAENVHKGHRQRLRDRASAEGFDEFNPHQIFELLLFYAIPRQDTSELAHRLIDRFGSVQGVFRASKEELVAVEGIGKRTAEWLTRVGELVNAYSELRINDYPEIRGFRTAFRFCREYSRGLVAPSCWQLAMTPSGRVQVVTKLCDGFAWGDAGALKNGLTDVLAAHAKNVIVVVFTGMDESHVEDLDRISARSYAALLHMMGVTLMDVVFVDNQHERSMLRMGEYDRQEYKGNDSALYARYLMEDEEPIDYGEELPLTDDGL